MALLGGKAVPTFSFSSQVPHIEADFQKLAAIRRCSASCGDRET